MTHFDTVVLGGGPGGYVAAIRCAQLGMRTAIIEKEAWGGVCLNMGSVPVKALLRNAEIADLLTHEKQAYGIQGTARCDYKVAFARSRTVADHMVKGVRFSLKKNKVTEYVGKGTFRGPRSLAVSLDHGVVESLTFDSCIIATGATPKVLAEVDKGPRVVTYQDFLRSQTLPRSLVICGSGPVGTELAYIAASYGVAVTIVEYLDRLLPDEDPDISAEVTAAYRDQGIGVLTSHAVKRITQDGGSARVYLTDTTKRSETLLEAEQAVMCVGFRPATHGYGLETSGVALTTSGAIGVDSAMRTNVPGIYAVGDVTDKLMLSQVAEAQAMIAAETIAGKTTDPIDYAMVPRAIHCQPQVASFGLTEAQARQKGHRIEVSKYPFSANARAWGIGRGRGFVKLVVDTTHGEILGVHMVGDCVTELLGEFTLAQKWDLTAGELARNLHTRPSLSEAISEVAAGAFGPTINI